MSLYLLAKTYGVSPWDYVSHPARYQFDLEVTALGADAEQTERRLMEGRDKLRQSNTTRRRYR